MRTDHLNDEMPELEAVCDFDPAGSSSSVAVTDKSSEFALIESSSRVSASTNNPVEKMQYLYVSVVRAKDLPLPAMEIPGSLNPYVEVKLGNFKMVTKNLQKNQNPVWNQFFVIPKEMLNSNLLEMNVKDKDSDEDDYAGRISFDLSRIPLLLPRDGGQLALQWYRLEDKNGNKIKGEILLAVWMGTQADEFFPDSWHSDAHNIPDTNLFNNRSTVYFSQRLYYLRVHIFDAYNLVLSDTDQDPEILVKVQLLNQVKKTKKLKMHAANPLWNEEMMFVASEPFEDYIVVTVEHGTDPVKTEPLGSAIVPVRDIPHRTESIQLQNSCWYNLLKPSSLAGEEIVKKEKFSSKIRLRLVMDAGYHVLDESSQFSSDLQPSSKHLKKGSIGILELGILSARNLLAVKGNDGRTTNPYCVAKYGTKWVRTRSMVCTSAPSWLEQYTWEVFDPFTVITIGVFDDFHINENNVGMKDQRIGKVRIRLSTLETDRIYTNYYPLLVLQPSGLKNQGELQLSVRFTCTSWLNLVARYGKPLLPKMHYLQPISVRNIDFLRHNAMQIVASWLARAEPPLRKEVVEYMLDVDYGFWSPRKIKVHIHRIISFLSVFTAICRWLDDIRTWKNPVTTCLVHVWFFILVSNPTLILPTFFLYLFVIGIWNYRFRLRQPPQIDASLSQAHYINQDELDEEFDTFPTSRSSDIVRMRYDRLRSVAGRVQTVVGDLAAQGERALGIVSWRDPRATSIFIVYALVSAVSVYFITFQVVAILVCLYLLRPPRVRSKRPSVPANYFKRLPCKSDMLL